MRLSIGAAGGLGALMLATFVAITTEILPVGLLPQMSREFGQPVGVVGLVVTLYAVVVAILSLPLVRFTARFPRKPLLLAAIGGYGLSSAIVAIAPNFAVLCVGRAIGGVAHALFFSVVAAYASRLVPPNLVGRAIAIAFAGTSLGYVLGVPLATFVGAAVGWRVGFASLAGASVLLILITGSLLPSVAHDASQSTARVPLVRSGLVSVAIVTVLVFLAEYTGYTYIAPILISAGLPTGSVGACLLLFGGAGILGLWTAGLLIDRRPRTGAVVTFVMLGLGLAIAAFATRSLPVLIVAATLWSTAFGAAPSYVTTAAIRASTTSPDIGGAVNNATSNLGIAGGAGLGAVLLAGAGSPGPLAVAAVIAAVAAVAVAFANRGFPGAPVSAE